MSKIAKIKEIIKEAQELVDEVSRDVNEKVENYNLALEEFRVAKESIKLSAIDELQEAIEGIQNLPEAEFEPEIVEEEMEPLHELEPPKIYEVQEPKTGVFKAKFWGFVTFLVVLAAFVLTGAFMRHIDPLSFFGSQWRQSLEESFGFFSALITQSGDAGAAIGMVVSLAAAFGLGYLVYYLLLSQAATKNLARAQEVFEEAKHWSKEQRSFIEKLKNIVQFLQDANYTAKGLKLFGEEFGARVKRARFFEGEDFSTMSQHAKDEVQRAQQLHAKLSQLAALELYAKDYELALSVKEAIASAKSLLETLKE